MISRAVVTVVIFIIYVDSVHGLFFSLSLCVSLFSHHAGIDDDVPDVYISLSLSTYTSTSTTRRREREAGGEESDCDGIV